MEDLSLHDYLVKRTSTPQLDNTIKHESVVTFYLGKHGPFTERFPVDAALDVELRARIEALRAQLLNFPV